MNEKSSQDLDPSTDIGVYRQNLETTNLIKDKVKKISKIIKELKKLKNG